jgi:hypothetical protein
MITPLAAAIPGEDAAPREVLDQPGDPAGPNEKVIRGLESRRIPSAPPCPSWRKSRYTPPR